MKLEPDRVAAGFAVTVGALAVVGVYELLNWLRDAEAERQAQREAERDARALVCVESEAEYGRAGYYEGVRCAPKE